MPGLRDAAPALCSTESQVGARFRIVRTTDEVPLPVPETQSTRKLKPASAPRNLKETSYSDRTDSAEQKLRQLEAAYQQRDFRLAHALTDSFRQTLRFEEQQGSSIGALVLLADWFIPFSHSLTIGLSSRDVRRHPVAQRH